MKAWMKRKAEYLYLDRVCAVNFPEQEPESTAAEWYHLFLWCIPLFGTELMADAIWRRAQRLGIKSYWCT